MRLFVILCAHFLLLACASHRADNTAVNPTEKTNTNVCVGEVTAPAVFAPMLSEIENPELVKRALGEDDLGGLCQARAYQVNQSFDVYRAWNSQNPFSQYGHWWSFSIPSGKISEYRTQYAICPKFSPLDMLVRCALQEGSVVVLGTGQSAACSAHLTYPVSSTVQIYIPNASEVTQSCQSFYGVFSWQNVDKNPKTKAVVETPSEADNSY
ncbi:hypothetical protein [Planctobacterium marinum]|uniref:hypothetical protein n=1 Tax=Planctobacterium marinum TaxID=1631968 RepID=UPI001E347538|nr:hypothetical protein [Planctobacterium marinum]MCC2604542.1 hypothetical protein [Planctobacterium marinum]